MRLIPASPADIASPPPELLRGVAAGYASVDDGLAALAEILAIMGARPRPAPWADWWALEGDAIVGLCGFKAPPDDSGTVEIGYGSFPRCEGRGVATAMAAGLVAIAAEAGARRVIAHTIAPDNASTTVLKRGGFAAAGTIIDPEDGLVWRWERALTPPSGARQAGRGR